VTWLFLCRETRWDVGTGWCLAFKAGFPGGPGAKNR
jgi:hypothetical protein